MKIRKLQIWTMTILKWTIIAVLGSELYYMYFRCGSVKAAGPLKTNTKPFCFIKKLVKQLENCCFSSKLYMKYLENQLVSSRQRVKL